MAFAPALEIGSITWCYEIINPNAIHTNDNGEMDIRQEDNSFINQAVNIPLNSDGYLAQTKPEQRLTYDTIETGDVIIVHDQQLLFAAVVCQAVFDGNQIWQNLLLAPAPTHCRLLELVPSMQLCWRDQNAPFRFASVNVCAGMAQMASGASDQAVEAVDIDGCVMLTSSVSNNAMFKLWSKLREDPFTANLTWISAKNVIVKAPFQMQGTVCRRTTDIAIAMSTWRIKQHRRIYARKICRKYSDFFDSIDANGCRRLVRGKIPLGTYPAADFRRHVDADSMPRLEMLCVFQDNDAGVATNDTAYISIDALNWQRDLK